MTVYQGRKWDAPMTDDAVEGVVTGTCSLCQEQITPDDNAIATTYMRTHLEWDVRHLEGRCSCAGGSDAAEAETYRESARATLDWLITHNRGRFHP